MLGAGPFVIGFGHAVIETGSLAEEEVEIEGKAGEIDRYRPRGSDLEGVDHVGPGLQVREFDAVLVIIIIGKGSSVPASRVVEGDHDRHLENLT